MSETDLQGQQGKTFALDDDQVVVIIGSGAGGGTLANELAQQGVDASSWRPASCTRGPNS